MFRISVIVTLCTFFIGCTGYARFIEGLNARQINSCVEGNIVVSTGILANGTARVYTGTGGALVQDCMDKMMGRLSERQLTQNADILRELQGRLSAPPAASTSEADVEQWRQHSRELLRELLTVIQTKGRK